MLHIRNEAPAKNRSVVIRFCVVLGFLCINHSSTIAAQTKGNPKDIIIIANKKVPENSLNRQIVRDMFLKVRTAWGNGKRVTPINPKDEQLRNDFRNSVLIMDKTAEQRYWEEQKVKSGLSKPPDMTNNVKAVFKLVGAISYVYRMDLPGDVAKVLLVIPANEN